MHFRYPIIFGALLFLALGILSGLGRLGLVGSPIGPVMHGPIMVSAFLGTLIGVERAVGLEWRWVYLGPLCCIVGGVLALSGRVEAALLFTAGSLVLLLATLAMAYMHPGLHTAVMAGGALCWLVGNVYFYIDPVSPKVALWWAGFPVLTIVGERLQLSALRRPPRGAVLGFVLLVTVYVLAPSPYLWGGAAVLLSIWLFRYDIASRTVRLPGLVKYAAVCVLAAISMLCIHGILVITNAPRDAILHSVYLGFMMPMIFGHAPIIFPAIIQRPLPFTRVFYLPLVLLYLSLSVRIIGSILGDFWLLSHGAALNAVAIALFFLTVLTSLIRGNFQTETEPTFLLKQFSK